ncbi:hypothetical protein A3I95_02720 [Candidatus Nomurabacteria bacterium RIFCSPLOWO2_02_FULL_44_12]|uniref:Major facilitator superfamily (MFS) profile domain-containing protein n=1 Tax=Candidatus Nomurabacteria bacterium RIFCSPLOWO2_12_FULL_44_11 TaxID=1801796 RepID=A0A1F6Y3A0_9BACT|nr:MAG: hypothetical protein A3E95_02015 [Candidatus Nomurabacteria bacterium RIFCSPHIGHO2_12_FULL_44_22b]OGJ00822.1 MAG: hypothetical protein A3G53_01970 [Candidatus Nomurabacteria bacterium RIFCSPLOWO2_12_FULL_44_11]OGJ08636.1 MAG: hypothetical protein A3I95_02720 [Candidatus Nomurabacteria bacterium RIFCSPLOWO2_02_FULL_44_12]
MLKRIYLFFFTYMASMFFAQTLVIFWLSKNGFGFFQLLIYYIVAYLVALAGIFFFPAGEISARKSIFFGILFSMLQVFVLIKIFGVYQLYLSGLFSGLNVIFFWIPYNAMHFKFSHEDNHGLHSGMYYLITPILGITLQPLTGIVAEKFGFVTVFLIGVSLYIIPLILLRFLPSFAYEINVKKYFLLHSFNWSTFFQGMMSRVNYSFIPIFTLFFVKTPRQFGNFFGYLALMTAVASIINGHISDRMKNRKIFFYLTSTLSVLSFLLLPLAQNSYQWHIFAGIGSLSITLASPFWLAFNLDHYKGLGIEKTMALRELFLNLGYVATLAVGLVIFYFTSSAKTSLTIITLICLLLPVVSYYQRVYRK